MQLVCWGLSRPDLLFSPMSSFNISLGWTFQEIAFIYRLPAKGLKRYLFLASHQALRSAFGFEKGEFDKSGSRPILSFHLCSGDTQIDALGELLVGGIFTPDNGD